MSLENKVTVNTFTRNLEVNGHSTGNYVDSYGMIRNSSQLGPVARVARDRYDTGYYGSLPTIQVNKY